MEQKKLYRSKKNRMIAGVCGGLAEYLNVDPVIIRLIAVILLLPGGLPGFLPYIILWVVIPEASTDSTGTTPPSA
jgi:phage shock protein C